MVILEKGNYKTPFTQRRDGLLITQCYLKKTPLRFLTNLLCGRKEVADTDLILHKLVVRSLCYFLTTGSMVCVLYFPVTVWIHNVVTVTDLLLSHFFSTYSYCKYFFLWDVAGEMWHLTASIVCQLAPGFRASEQDTYEHGETHIESGILELQGPQIT